MDDAWIGFILFSVVCFCLCAHPKGRVIFDDMLCYLNVEGRVVNFPTGAMSSCIWSKYSVATSSTCTLIDGLHMCIEGSSK